MYELSDENLVLQHRIAAIAWARAHDEAFAKDENGNYLPPDPAKDQILFSAIDRTTEIEGELLGRLGMEAN